MEFEYSLKVTAGTAKASPVYVECLLSKGIIHRYEVVFPQGCNNLVSIVIKEGGFQCFPLNPDGDIKGNAQPVVKNTFYPLESRPFKLKAFGWAPDCTYDHTILLRFDVLPREYFDKTANTEALINAVTKELQREYVETAGAIADRLELIAQQVTVKEPAEPEGTEAETEGPSGPDRSVLDDLGTIDRAILEAQIRRGWTTDSIIAANKARNQLDPDKLPDIIKALRKEIEVSNG